MKKCFYIVLAAAAIVASCAKVELKEDQKIEPKAGATAQFSGTIIQPNGLGGGSKVYIAGQDETKVYVSWNKGDKVKIKREIDKWENPLPPVIKTFSAKDEGARTEFVCSEPIEDWASGTSSYSAYYFGTKNAWWEYVFATSFDTERAGMLPNKFEFDCGVGKEEEIPVLLENMPLYSKTSTEKDGYYYFNFICYYGILQINVPAKLDFSDLYVCLSANGGDKQDVTFESGALKEGSEYALRLKNAARLKNISKYEGQEYVTYFVPVAHTTVADSPLVYSEIQVVAVKGSIDDNSANEVARMKTYEYSNNSQDPVMLNVDANTIHFFDFCNTLTIKKADTYNLVSNDNINYKVNIASNIDSEVTIDAEEDGFEPDSIFINNHGHTVGTLIINARKSHVEGEKGFADKVVANTSNSTFVVKPTLHITGLTVKKGSVVVEGNENQEANVEEITIPEGVTEQITIDVTGVSSTEKKVKIYNYSKANVFVVTDPTDIDGDKSKEYEVIKGEVTPINKEIVATIGTTGYATLAEAVAAVNDNETITLIKDVEIDKAICTGAKTFTLTANANITSVADWGTSHDNANDALIIVNRGGDLTINGTGKISSDHQYVYSAVKMTNNGEDTGAAAKLTVEGDVTLEGLYYGICGHGNRQDTEITVKGGTIKGIAENDNAGIYNPQNGKLTIIGGTIEGAVGIYVKAGVVETTTVGGTIKGVGKKDAFQHNGSGIYNTGDAFVVENCGYPGGTPNVTISGGSFISTNADAVASYAYGSGNTPVTGFVTGGLFNKAIDAALVAPGYAVVDNTDEQTKDQYPYTVKESEGVCKIGSKVYATLAEAVAAVPTGGTETTIQMVAEFATTEEVTIGVEQNVVLDLNGKTISYTTDGFGSYITNKGQLKITDSGVSGTITAKFSKPDWNNGCYTVNNFGGSSKSSKLIIEAGTIENTSPAGLAWPVNNGSWGTSADLVINGGTIHSKNYVPVREYLQYGGTKTIVINGGKFISDNSRAIAIQFSDATVIDKGSYVTINGGEFSCNGSGILYADLHAANINTEGFTMTVNNGKFYNANTAAPVLVYDYESRDQSSAVLLSEVLKGGIYSAKPSDDIVAEGFEAIKNSDPETTDQYPWMVKESELQGVAKIGSEWYDDLDEALGALKTGETLEIWKAGEYTVETLSTPANTTVEGMVDGIVFNHTAAATSWVAKDKEGKTVKNVTWNVGNAHHQYISNTNLENCTVNGLLCTHNTNKFKDCTFINEEGYNFWVYGNVYTEFDNCTFTCPGKNDGVFGCGSALNCYNEEAQTPTPVLVVKNCTFTAKEASNKYSAIYIKTETAFDIRITNSTCNDKFCTGAISGSKLWNLKADREGTTVSVDGNRVYPF